MFEGFSVKTIDFMWNIRINNEKSWFEAHKDEYLEHFYRPMQALAHDVFENLINNHRDKNLITKVSRIYRDARRLHGRGPYKDHLWFSIEKPGIESAASPVFWFELEPEGWSCGLGYYQAKASSMAKLRARIDENPRKFEKLIAPLDKQKEFLLDGPEYVRVKTAPTQKTQNWYNRKSLSLIHNEKHCDILFSPELVNYLVNGYEFLMPFYDFLLTIEQRDDHI